MAIGKADRRYRQPTLLSNLPFVIIIALGIFVFWWVFFYQSSIFSSDAESRLVTPRGELAADEESVISLFERTSPSVVHISTTTPQFRREGYFRLSVYDIPQGDGSGFVWDEDGHIVTNFHVIKNAKGIYVKFADKDVYPARLVGAMPDKDIAVLHIDAPERLLVPIMIGESRNLRVGQKVFAIGNPFGFDQSLSTGVVSALGREIMTEDRKRIQDVIQTDAAINPGNSGGPLLDSAGRLIGVNTAISSPSGGSAGVGFAIPVDDVNTVVPQIIRHGYIGRPGLGVYAISTSKAAANWGIDKGFLIGEVMGGSAAEAAGLRGSIQQKDGSLYVGDIILAVNGASLACSDDLTKELSQYSVGDKVELTIKRGKETMKVAVTLQRID